MIPKSPLLKIQVVVLSLDTREVLLLQTCQDRGGFWQNVTGHVESGESSKQAAGREIFEEIGLLPQQLNELPLKFSFKNKFGQEINEAVFSCLFQSRPTITLSSEHQQFEWLSWIKVIESNFRYSTNFEAFLKAKESL